VHLGPNQVPISTGWNLISLPTSAVSTASGLVSAMDATGQIGAGAIQEVAVFRNGAYQTYLPGAAQDITGILPSQGVWVLSASPGIWIPSGSGYTASQPVSLSTGWNLVGAPFPGAGLGADQVMSEVGGGTVLEVAAFSGGTYQTYVPGGPSPFHIANTAGFWVLASSATTWNPS
jgi:hypothetical protein